MTKKKQNNTRNAMFAALAVLTALLVFNQAQIITINNAMGGNRGMDMLMPRSVSNDLSAVNVEEIQSTAQGLAAIFELEGATQDEVIAQMLPSGTPPYGEAMGVSYDDPVGSLSVMAKAYPSLKQQIKQNDPAAYQRWLDLASNPRGISCEYCCSIGAYAIRKDGQDMCGCQHHPALQTLTLWLIQNTDMSDAEILQEAYRWKTLFFPKDMIGLGTQIAGGDDSVLTELPGMVGGC